MFWNYVNATQNNCRTLSVYCIVFYFLFLQINARHVTSNSYTSKSKSEGFRSATKREGVVQHNTIFEGARLYCIVFASLGLKAQAGSSNCEKTQKIQTAKKKVDFLHNTAKSEKAPHTSTINPKKHTNQRTNSL